MKPGFRRRYLLALPWGAAIVLWLRDAVATSETTAPSPLDTVVAWTALAATFGFLALLVARTWKRDRSGRILLGLVAVAAVTFFTGLGQEVVGRYFGDEGIYLAQARRINRQGQLLRPWFIYPHLLFYLDAFALWLASSLGPVVTISARLLYGIDHTGAIEPLVTRGVTASMGTATVVPTFIAARRIAGPMAAGLGGALIALCPIYVRVAHLNISDVVGAFFAAMTVMQCALLLDRETGRGYVLAGLWAGLAAGGKYPAGVVAVAIAGVWVGWRLRKRDLDPGLVYAALTASVAFVGTTPSFLAFPKAALAGEGTADLLFGFRQYARSGWTGVVRASNAGFYLDRLAYGFGAPGLILGLTGIPWLERRARRRLCWLIPFPVVYLALMLGMRIAVERNLLPVLPVLSALLGAGATGWVALAQRRGDLRRAGVAIALALVFLGSPAWRGGLTVIQFSRPTTRELAAEWIPENLPPGSALVQEVYTPRIQPKHLYPAIQPRFVVRLRPEELRDPRFDFVFLASQAYGRFFRPETLDEHYREPGRQRYEEIFETFEPVAEWVPNRFRAGPRLRLYELDPAVPSWTDQLDLGPSSLRTATPAMRRDRDGDGDPEGPVVFQAPGQWALAKGYLEPGDYAVTVEADPERGGTVQVLTRRGEEIDLSLFLETAEGARARVLLPRRDKYFFYLRMPPGCRLRNVRIERSDRSPEEISKREREPGAPSHGFGSERRVSSPAWRS